MEGIKEKKNFKDKANNILSPLKNNLIILDTLVIFITWGIEEITNELNFFVCPCLDCERKANVLLFILGPVILFGILGMAINSEYWKFITGCSKKSNDYKKNKSKFCGTLLQSLIGLLAWVVVTLLDGRYIACYKVKPYVCKKLNDEAEKAKIEVDEREWKAISQTIGWGLLLGFILVVFVIYTVYKCCGNYTYRQERYSEIYRKNENQLFDEEAEKRAKSDGEKCIKKFFEVLNEDKDGKNSKENWDKITFSPKENYYTSLQRWYKQQDPSPKNSPEKNNESKAENESGPESEPRSETAQSFSPDKDQPLSAMKWT